MVTTSTCNKTDASALNQRSLRGDARHSVAGKWAARRKKGQAERESKPQSTTIKNDAGLMSSDGKGTEFDPVASLGNDEGGVAVPSKESQKSPPLPFCVLLQRSWKEFLLSFQRQQSSQRTNFPAVDPTTSPLLSAPPLSKRASFPSVISILQAQALKRQVESFLHDETSGATVASHRSTSSPSTNHSTTPTTESRTMQPILNILPADYDFQQAIEEMTKSRSRVFWLLDLAAIIHACITCRKHFKGQVQLAYRLHHNAHPKLLQLLHGLGVVLLVATKYDLQVCERQLNMSIPNRDNKIELSKNATNNNKSRDAKWIRDDPSFTSKPNSFYRQLLLHGASDESAPIAVDGPRELLRLVSSLKSIAERRDQIMPELRFTLKLQASHGIKRWQRLLTSTLDASCNAGCHAQVVGIAVDLPVKKSQDILGKCLQHIRSLLEYYSDPSRDHGSAPERLHLTLCNHSYALDSQVSDWLLQSVNQNLFESVTLDVSQMLVTDASALCTRIIGVKQTEAGKIHYYIDDGCYGSLSNVVSIEDEQNDCSEIRESGRPCHPTARARVQLPMPLQLTKVGKDGDANTTFKNRMLQNGGLDDKPMNVSRDEELFLATVWGPTCDGLDKVCSDIELPRLCRDDWLVFTDIGFCHVGTTFNGFAPPDIAFCVLGKGAGYYMPPAPADLISVRGMTI